MDNKGKIEKINKTLGILEKDLETIESAIKITEKKYNNSKNYPEIKSEFENAISDLEDEKNKLLRTINKCREKKQELVGYRERGEEEETLKQGNLLDNFFGKISTLIKI